VPEAPKRGEVVLAKPAEETIRLVVSDGRRSHCEIVATVKRRMCDRIETAQPGIFNADRTVQKT